MRLCLNKCPLTLAVQARRGALKDPEQPAAGAPTMGKDTSDRGLIASGLSPLMRQVGLPSTLCLCVGGCGLIGPEAELSKHIGSCVGHFRP